MSGLHSGYKLGLGLAVALTAVVTAGAMAASDEAWTDTHRAHDAPGTPSMHMQLAHGGGERMYGRRHGRGEMFMQWLRDADSDGDGAISQAELDAYRTARIASVDTSNDGALDLTEFEALFIELGRSHMVDAFKRLDEDGDGQISTEELDARFGGIVERFDRNGDGVLSEEDGGRRHRG